VSYWALPWPSVRKTTVYLRDEEAMALRRLAHSEGVPRSNLLRKGVRLVLEAAANGTLGRHPPIPTAYRARGEPLVEASTNGGWDADERGSHQHPDERLTADDRPSSHTSGPDGPSRK